MNDNQNNSNNNSYKKSDITITDILQILKRRQKTLYIILISTLISVSIFNFFAKPVYESTVTLKKENIDTKSPEDQFKQMFSMKTTDELETEMEIIKTRNVLEKVVSELNLSVIIKLIELSGETIELDEPVSRFNRRNASKTKSFPHFNRFIVNSYYPSISAFYLKVQPDNYFGLFIEENDSLLQSVKYDSIAEFSTAEFTFEIKWDNARQNDQIHFQLRNFESAQKSLKDKITVTPVGKTNIFKVSFEAKSPDEAQIVVSRLVEKYRESRLAQKRQTISYSVDFVNENLNDVTTKLKNAELELSEFKSRTKILSLNESTNEIVNFLSNLESKKVQTDLDLAEYRSKLRAMQTEQQKGGFVDQTYLAPSNGERGRSPFSTLLEQLSDAEIQRLELLQRRMENHPDVIAVDRQIEQIENRLSEFNQNTMTSYKIIINTLAKKQIDLNRLITKYSARLEDLPAQETILVELIRKKNVFENMYNLLLDKQEKLRMAEFSTLLDIIIVDPALIPNEPISPKKGLNIILAIFLGTIFGLTAIFLQEFFDKKVENIDEMENLFSTSILTIIPRYNKELEKDILNAESQEEKLVTLMNDQQEYLESYRLLRTRLLNFANSKNKAFIFTSSEPDTGKSTIVANLGVSLAMLGKKVLLIDCDLKKAGLSYLFSIPEQTPNYLKYLMNETDPPEPYKPFRKNNSEWDLNILNAGYGYVENSSELLQTEKMKKLINKVSLKYDFILIDTPPVTQVVDTLILGNYVQNVIYVVKQSHTYKEGVKFAFEELKQSAMNVCGLVINAGNLNSSAYKYRYGYKYGYGDYKKT